MGRMEPDGETSVDRQASESPQTPSPQKSKTVRGRVRGDHAELGAALSEEDRRGAAQEHGLRDPRLICLRH